MLTGSCSRQVVDGDTRLITVTSRNMPPASVDTQVATVETQQQQQQQQQQQSRHQQQLPQQERHCPLRSGRTISEPLPIIGRGHKTLLLNSISDCGSSSLVAHRGNLFPSGPGVTLVAQPDRLHANTSSAHPASRSGSQRLDTRHSTGSAFTHITSHSSHAASASSTAQEPVAVTAKGDRRQASLASAAPSLPVAIAVAPAAAPAPETWVYSDLPPLLLHQLLQALDQISVGSLRLVCQQTRDVVDNLMAEQIVAGKCGVNRLLRLCLPQSTHPSLALESHPVNTRVNGVCEVRSCQSVSQDPSIAGQQQPASSEYSYYSLYSCSSFSPFPHLTMLVLNFPDAGSGLGGGRRSGAGGGTGCAALVRLLTSGALLQLPALHTLDLTKCGNCGWHKETAMLIEESLLPPSLRVIRLSGASKLAASPALSLSSPSSYISPLAAWVTSLTTWRTSQLNQPWLLSAPAGPHRLSPSDPGTDSRGSVTSQLPSDDHPRGSSASTSKSQPRLQIHVVGPTTAPHFIHPQAGFFLRQPSSSGSSVTSFTSALDRIPTPGSSKRSSSNGSSDGSSVPTRSPSPTRSTPSHRPASLKRARAPSDSPNSLPPLTPMLLNLPLTLTQLLLPSRRLNPVEVRLLGQIPSLVGLEVLCLDLSHPPSPAEEADGGSAAAASGRLPAVVLPSLKRLVVHAYFNLGGPLASHFPRLAWLHMGRPNQVSDRAVCSSRLDLLRSRAFRGAGSLAVLSLCGGGFPADFHDAMRDLSGLRELQLHGLLCGTWVDTLVGACRTLPLFQHLYLSRCAAYPSSHPRAAEQILATDWLDHPQLSICDARVDTEHQILNHLTAPGAMQRIEKLTLAELPFLTENEVLRVVSRVPRLSRLTLRGCMGMSAPFLQCLSTLVGRPEVSVAWVEGAPGGVPGCAWSML
ncbi:MAG: hypothetical protein WDW36_001816 [Sanguina aurantia]